MKHDWQPYVQPSGRWKGHVNQQRRCTRCELWETEMSRLAPCEPVDNPVDNPGAFHA